MVPQPVWMLWRREKSLPLMEIEPNSLIIQSLSTNRIYKLPWKHPKKLGFAFLEYFSTIKLMTNAQAKILIQHQILKISD
jgi:hypothetical protein